eukprot:superscaffoldBa00002427_g14203
MVKRWKLGRRSNDSRRPLIENNNNDIQEGGDQAGEGYDNPSAQNTFNTIEEQCLQIERDLTFQELAELLKVAPDTISVGSDTSENGSCCAIRNLGQEKQQSVVRLIQRSVCQHFPTPPAELDKNLQRHLLEVETAVHTELARLAPLFKSRGLIGYLLDCYHRQTSDHLHGLLQHISTSKNSFMLLKWVLHTYLSQDLLGAASPQEVDHIKDVDLMLFTELAAKAKDKLLEIVQRVMDETYKLITHLYFKHLVQSNQSKLRRCWGSNVGQQVTQDAEVLHYIISDMAPGVKQWNRILLKITETLECEDNDALKIVVASMQQKCITKSCRKDLELLLRWKGLSKREVREVLEALPDHQQTWIC